MHKTNFCKTVEEIENLASIFELVNFPSIVSFSLFLFSVTLSLSSLPVPLFTPALSLSLSLRDGAADVRVRGLTYVTVGSDRKVEKKLKSWDVSILMFCIKSSQHQAIEICFLCFFGLQQNDFSIPVQK